MKNPENLSDLLRNPRKRAWVELLAKWYLGVRYHIHVSGQDHVQDLVEHSDRPFIVVSNHEGFWDGFIFGVLVPSLDFAIAKEEGWLNPLFRFFVQDLGGIPVARKEKLAQMQRRYPSAFEHYISNDGRFKYGVYLPGSRAGDIVWDIMNTVGTYTDISTQKPKRIGSVEDLDAVILSQYVILKGNRLLHFYQGTRMPNHSVEGIQYGLYNIASDLIEHHDLSIPILPSAIWYKDVKRWRSAVGVAFGEPLSSRLLLKRTAENRHRHFMYDVKTEIEHQLLMAKKLCLL